MPLGSSRVGLCLLIAASSVISPTVAFQALQAGRLPLREGWLNRPTMRRGLPMRIRGGASDTEMLGDYRGAASALFNNMRTPAALICGAIVPLGLLGAPRIEKEDSKRLQFLKRAHQLLALACMYNELLAITYSTIAVNKLTEVNMGPTNTVVELIGRDYELPWIGTNLHFLAGLAGFGLMVGLRPFFNFGVNSVVARISCLWTISMLFTGMSIVNRGIAQGDGSMGVTGRFADNLSTLLLRYFVLLGRDANGVLSILAMASGVASLALLAWELVKATQKRSGEDAASTM